MFERHIHHLLALIPKDGKTIDLQELFCRLTIDSGTELLFGVSCNSICDEHVDTNLSFSKALDTVQSEMIIRDVLGPYLSIFRSEKKFRSYLKTVHDFIDDYVKIALAALKAQDEMEEDSQEDIYFLRSALSIYTRSSSIERGDHRCPDCWKRHGCCTDGQHLVCPGASFRCMGEAEG
jgi:hypothetical protein